MIVYKSMVLSEYTRNKRQEVKNKAVQLYKAGLTFREVSKVLGVSHEWVRQAYLSTVSDQKN